MACYFHGTVKEFLQTALTDVLSQLVLHHAADGFAEMRSELPLTWWDDLDSLHVAMNLLASHRPDDLIRKGNQWKTRKFWTSGRPKWIFMKSETEGQYRKNAYRVLLTRARRGTIIYVPSGELKDPTRLPQEMNETAEYLIGCGVRRLRS